MATTTLGQGHHHIIPRKQLPNRMTRIFQQMKTTTCPTVISAYAQCVLQNEQAGTMNKGSCEHEFVMVKECFRTARQQLTTSTTT